MLLPLSSTLKSVSSLLVGLAHPARVLAPAMRHTGTVASFNNLKGIGLLHCDGGEDVFCHYSAICRPDYRTLVAGEIVAFDIVPGAHGDEAHNITVSPCIDL